MINQVCLWDIAQLITREDRESIYESIDLSSAGDPRAIYYLYDYFRHFIILAGFISGWQGWTLAPDLQAEPYFAEAMVAFAPNPGTQLTNSA